MKHIEKYINQTINFYKNIDLKKIEKIEKVILNKIKHNKQIFICGNGGSSSIANHFLCDFNKGIKNSSNYKLLPKVISLSDNMEMITAISNDIDYKKIFSLQLENYGKRGDLLVTMSCSGNSPNIIEVIKYAKKSMITTISLTGFASTKIRNLSDINFDIGLKNYGISEDIFQSLMHMISQNIRYKYSSNRDKKVY